MAKEPTPLYRTPAGLTTQPAAPPKKPLAAAVAAMIAAVIAVEGGYVNHPSDPGGETKYGITKQVAHQNGYYGPLRTLPREVAGGVFYQRYLVDPGYAPLVAIDAPVTAELFDTTVNMGAARPSQWFQQSINEMCGTKLVVDGKIGAGTIAAYQGCQSRLGSSALCMRMLDTLDAKQFAEYRRLVVANPKLKVFYNGWVHNRIGNVDRKQCNWR